MMTTMIHSETISSSSILCRRLNSLSPVLSTYLIDYGLFRPADHALIENSTFKGMSTLGPGGVPAAWVLDVRRHCTQVPCIRPVAYFDPQATSADLLLNARHLARPPPPRRW